MTVSLVARPSAATSERSASTGPRARRAAPSLTGYHCVDHGAPRARVYTAIRRRPGAVTRTVVRSPRSTSPGASIPSGGRSVPRQARTGCSTARHPSGALDASATHVTAAAAATRAQAPARRRALRWVSGASADPPERLSLARRATRSAAPRRPRGPECSTSSAPCRAPARSDRSRSMVRETAERVTAPRNQKVVRAVAAAMTASATAQTKNGTAGDSASHRASPRSATAAASTKATPAHASATPCAAVARPRRPRSRSTSSATVT